ncbi:NAD(P)H-hydrate epimerase [Novosphingobium sp. Gsoil 351]|uniref:NAD(P)H-hydrate epimerase n=1 Tax=Novosphingobium sp. Gsoil 351 TaxID=2675225 RepID=UPI00351B6189
MLQSPDQILTIAQMRAAEQALIERGSSVEALMDIAGRGAAEWIWRISGGRAVTVLCGPGNNGGDGWVIAETIRARGGEVAVISPQEPVSVAAQSACAKYHGALVEPDARRGGEVFVDCLFGSGLTRALSAESADLIARLARHHHAAVAIDLPSGIESDSGAVLNPGLPHYDLTIALGAWNFAHWSMPATAMMGQRRLFGIGCAGVAGAARLLARPGLRRPAVDAHKYSRGLLGIVAGTMPGAALLAARAAMHGGAGYVKLLGETHAPPPELVVDERPLGQALDDRRWSAILVGPGLGRDDAARARLAAVLATNRPTVVDADALTLLSPADAPLAAAVLTPHEGELAALEQSFSLPGTGLRRDRALAVAKATGAVVLLKGADSLIAMPDGTLILAPAAPSWLSVAGSGDVLAGLLASRLAVHGEPLRAAEEALWLHGEAARIAGPAFTAGQLAEAAQGAIAAALE